MNGQLVLAAIPEELEGLLPHVLEDAASFREQMGDDEAAEKYARMAAELEDAT